MGVEAIKLTGILPARALTGSTGIMPRPGSPGNMVYRATRTLHVGEGTLLSLIDKDPKPAPPTPGTSDPIPMPTPTPTPRPPDDPDDDSGPLTR